MVKQISAYIVKKVVTCTPKESVTSACEKMAKHNIGTIVVVDAVNKKKPIGIFTERDLVANVIAKGKTLETALDAVMSKKLVTAPHDATEAMISNLMAKHKVKKVVILKDNTLYGIITQTDMMRVLTDAWLQ